MNILAKLKSLLPKNTKNSSHLIFEEIYTIKGEPVFVVSIYALDFKKLLNKLLEDHHAQMFWNDIKEKYRKKLDEQKLYKVFEFFIFALYMESLLNDMEKELTILGLLSNERGYYLYRDPKLFNGDLDEETFKKFLEKMWNYFYHEFYKKIF
jgi:hypothetical protein